MSGQATGWVLRHGPHPDHLDRDGRPYGARARGLRAVLHTVADAANPEGQHAHPGLEAVCRGSLYGRRQAVTLLGELVAEGWLSVEAEGGGRSNATTYRLSMEPRPLGNSAMAATEAAETVQSAPLNGAMAAAKGCNLAPETVQPGLHPNVITNELLNGKAQRASADPADGFEEFWQAYPRRVAKANARTAWRAAVKAASPQLIIAGAVRYASDPNLPTGTDVQFIPHPATWLRGERWGDPPLPARTNGRPAPGPSRLGARDAELMRNHQPANDQEF